MQVIEFRIDALLYMVLWKLHNIRRLYIGRLHECRGFG